MYFSSYKKITFNCYFIITIQIFFPKVIHFYVKINYRNYRNLQDNENGDADEETKSLCNLVDSNIKYQVKYECELEINEKDKDILNVKSLDKFEFDGKKIEIQNSSFLHSLYKNNMENAKDDIFNKPLYILENSVVNNNEEEFNITGNLIGDNFNYNNKLVFQFHSDKNNGEVTNSNCSMIKSNEKEYILKCVPDSPINSKIVDGYSDLGDGKLIIMFKNDDNKIEMLPIKTNENENKTNIISIAISFFVVLLFVVAAMVRLF
jgi:hypothetical protein